MDRAKLCQRISYAKGKSDIVSRLDGTARVREGTGADVTMTDAQKSAFGTAAASLDKQTSAVKTNGVSENTTAQAQGTKRRRPEDENEEVADAAADEDDGEDDAMEMEESDED